MKFSEFKDLSPAELARREAELRQEYANLRLQQASGQLENTARLRAVRKAIARVLTAASQRRHAASN